MTMHTQRLSSDDNIHGQVGRDSNGQFVSLAIGRAATNNDESLEGAGRLVTHATINPRHRNFAFMFVTLEEPTEAMERLHNGEGILGLTHEGIASMGWDPETTLLAHEELTLAGAELDASYAPEPNVETKAEAVARRAAAARKRHLADKQAKAAGLPTRSQRRAANKRARKAALLAK